MLILDRKNLIFKVKEIHFSDYPYDVDGCDAVVFYYCKDEVGPAGFTCREDHTSVIDLTQDLDTIWGSMSKGNCRKPINRAERAGVKVKLNENYDEFYEMYHSVRSGKSLTGFSISLKDIKRYATLFVAEFDGEVISGHGYLEDENNMKSWVIGSKRFEKNKEYATLVGNASKLIIWEAIKYAKERGIKEFDMGGLWSDEEAEINEIKRNINFFKQSFGGKTITCYNYQKAYSPLYKLGSYLYNKANRLRK